jgi:A/G-specific adenine glycosylase
MHTFFAARKHPRSPAVVEVGREAGLSRGSAGIITLEQGEITSFRRLVYAYYRACGRDLPWRRDPSPYEVLVSEVMLQQTQVNRVLKKYDQFLRLFPTIRALADAPTGSLLGAWQGLGYNRRALSLKKSAAAIVAGHGGRIPCSRNALESLPGIGPATASAIMAFAFNEPVPFIETNIRSVYLYYFYFDSSSVRDTAVLSLVKQTLDVHQPRNWYYALMDYGAALKKRLKDINKKSAHYTRQSRFEGSNRQLRGAAVRVLLKYRMLSCEELAKLMDVCPRRTKEVLLCLAGEGIIRQRGDGFSID